MSFADLHGMAGWMGAFMVGAQRYLTTRVKSLNINA